jgi:subtilase family serine protease
MVVYLVKGVHTYAPHEAARRDNSGEPKMNKQVGRCLLGAVSAAFIFVIPLHAFEKAKLAERASAQQPVAVDIYIPVQDQAKLDQFLQDLQTSGSPNYHHWLTPAEFHKRFSPNAATLQAAKDELTSRGLSVTEVSPRHLRVSGNAGDVEQTFATELVNGSFSNNKSVIVATQPVTLTPKLRSLNAVVTSLSPVIHMHPNAVRLADQALSPDNRYSPIGAYWFTDLKQAYSWPSYKVFAGTGTTIGVLMTGGYNPADMILYFHHEKLAKPSISEVDIDGGAPFDPNNSFETHLDIQQSGGMAPKANIILYNMPDLSDKTISDGISRIIEDNKADVVNMSFSGPEISYLPSFNNGMDLSSILRMEDDLFKQGNAQGITFVSSSGDLGALSVPAFACFDPKATQSCGGFLLSAEFPASSPHVTGVGGTNLITTTDPKNPKNLNSAYVSEHAFGDPLAMDIFYGTPATGGFWGSGGGDSVIFAKPAFQNLVQTGSKVRTVPDVSLHMGGCPFGSIANPCPADRSFDVVAIGGKFFGVIGTSASSPDFAGLIALSVQRFGTRLGNANFYIYSLGASQAAGQLQFHPFRKNIPGFNGFYFTGGVYDRVLGLGTVSGKNFLQTPLVEPAGRPQTPTNP